MAEQFREQGDYRPTRVKRWGLAVVVFGAAIGTSLLAACADTPAEEQSDPTGLFTATPNVTMYSFEERDFYPPDSPDGIINILDVMAQTKGKGLEGEDFNFNGIVDSFDVAKASSLYVPGEYKPRIDFNMNGDNSDDLAIIADDLEKKLPSGGKLRADELEAGWYDNQIGVRFKPGSEADMELAEIQSKIRQSQSEEEYQQIAEEIRTSALGFLGLDTSWELKGFNNPATGEGFTVLLLVPEEILNKKALGVVIENMQGNPKVLDASRNQLANLPSASQNQ